jgi:PAS domain S-box-containing protein
VAVSDQDHKMKRLGLDPQSLPAQMILSFVVLVLLTAVAIGLPAIWLIRDQLTRQAWAQVEQGRRATQALYASRQSEIIQLATLTAQRPTLQELLANGERSALAAYLRTLQVGAGLDLTLVCDSEKRAVAQAGELSADTLCITNGESGFHIVSNDSPPQVWLFATHPIGELTVDREPQSVVVVGSILDDELAVQMRDQTGLEHTVLVDGRPAATSLPAGIASHRPCEPASSSDVESHCRVTFSLDGAPYYAIRIPLSEAGPRLGPETDADIDELHRGVESAQTSGLEAEMALLVSDIVATQRRLALTLMGAISFVVALGSGTGAVLARRIGQPLNSLTEAAAALSKGDLSEPLMVEARVREVALVAEALEGARVDLRQTLDRLRQEKAWTEHLLEAIVEGIVTLDRHGRITFFSHGAERITGWQRDQVLGHTCNQVFEPLETDEPFSQLIPAPGRRRKIPVALRDGRQAILAFTGARLLPPEGGDARVALVFRDISEEEAVHRLLGHFLANVAHEFRTPLAAVAASVELLMDQAPDLTTDELGELLTSLHLGVLGLQTLVDNLLEGASIEAGHFRVTPRPADLSGIIAEAIRTTQPLLHKRSQGLVVEVPAAFPVVRADPRRLVQVLVNLLSNASKYGPDEAEITVGATVSEDWVRVTVADQGPGILPEQRQDLFRRFKYLGLSNDKAQYGVGLGLSVVKAIVEAHGGQIGVNDRPGGGSVFWFTLPRVNE